MILNFLELAIRNHKAKAVLFVADRSSRHARTSNGELLGHKRHACASEGEDQVDVAWHDAPTINLHSLLLSIEIETIQYYLEIYFAHKYINPINRGKTDKIEPFLIVELVLPAHSGNL